MTLKSQSQMLFWKIQKSKKNMLSTSLTLFKSQIVLALLIGETVNQRGETGVPGEKPLRAELRTNKLDLCFSHKSKRGLKNSVRPVQTSNSVSKRYLVVKCGEPIIPMTKIWKKAGKSTLKLVETAKFWSYI